MLLNIALFIQSYCPDPLGDFNQGSLNCTLGLPLHYNAWLDQYEKMGQTSVQIARKHCTPYN